MKRRGTNYRSIEEWKKAHPEKLQKFKTYEDYEGHRNAPTEGKGKLSFGEDLVKRKTHEPSQQIEETNCPYCDSSSHRAMDAGSRRQCNKCFRSYSLTTGTEYHKTHAKVEDLEKLKECYREGFDTRKASEIAGVSKNTAQRYFERWDERADEQTEDKDPFALFGCSSSNKRSYPKDWVEDAPEDAPKESGGLFNWLFGVDQKDSQQDKEVSAPEETPSNPKESKPEKNRFSLFGCD